VSLERKCVREAKRNSVGTNQTACRSFSDGVLKSLDLLLSRVRSGVVVCRNQCCRFPEQAPRRVELLRGLSDRMQRQMEQVLSPVGTGAEVSGTSAVACRIGRRRFRHRRGECQIQCCRVLEWMLSCVGTTAVASRIEC
jgi:hypothetical protein